MDLYERIMELGSMGYHCSQIIMIMTLETIGEENPQLVKAMGGLGEESVTVEIPADV